MSITGYRDANQAMQNLFRTAWEAGSYYLGTESSLGGLGVPAFYDNDPEREPTDQPNYVIFQVTPGKSQQVGLQRAGQRRFRQYGIVTVSVYTSIGIGTGLGESMVDFIANIFRGNEAGSSSLGGVILKAPRLDRVGQVDDHYRHNVVTDFYFDLLA